MNLAVISDTLASMIRIATPLMLMALGGLLCQRAGVFNIALEGFSLQLCSLQVEVFGQD